MHLGLHCPRLQFNSYVFARLLRDRARGLQPARRYVARAEAVAARRELPVLRRVGSGVHRARVAVDVRRLDRGAVDQRRDDAGRASGCCSSSASSSTSACSATSSTATSCSRTSSPALHAIGVDYQPGAVRHRVADRHLVLHVPHAVLHARRLPRAHEAVGQLPRLRALRHVLPGAGRRADPARVAVPAAVRRPRRTTARAARVGARAARARAVREERARRHRARAGRRRRVQDGWPRRPGRRVDRHARVRRADLLRLRRLLDVRDRRRAVPRVLAARQLPLARTPRSASPTSGRAGTSRCRPGCATTSTSRSAATASGRCARTST